MMISKKAESLLKELIDNKDNFIKLLQDKFYNFETEGYIDSNADTELRALLKELKDNGYLTKIFWGDNKPHYTTITPLGMEYFDTNEIDNKNIANITDNSINIGNDSIISKSKIGHNIVEEKKENNTLFWKIFVPILTAVVSGVILWIITSTLQ